MPAVSGVVHDSKDKARRRAQAINSFASDLHKRLPTEKDDTKAASALLSEVHKQVQTLEKYADKSNHGMLGDEGLERAGTNLWNLCTRLKRESADTATSKTSAGSKLVLESRVLAYQILHLSQWSSKSSARIATHLMRIALKAAKCCTDGHDVQTARSVLQRAADYHGRLQQLSHAPPQAHDNECTPLEAEWTAMRIVLAFQDDQLIIAEHAFESAESLLSKSDPTSAEKIVDSLYHVGKGLLSKKDYPMAEKWLQRAWDLINSQQLPGMSRDAVELRIAILQALVTVLMGLRTAESIDRAQNLVKYVESEVGDEPVVLLLNLDILSNAPGETFDGEAYANILRRMVRTFHPTESNFKLLGHHIHFLHTKCPGLGCSILDEFLSSLVKGGRTEWIDKVVTTRIHMAVSQRDFEGTVDDAHKALERLEEPVGVEASFAAQTLIWKRVDSNYSQAQFEMTERWCQLGLSNAFANSGPMNRAKIERKLLLCAINRNDLDTAKSVFFSMGAETQKDPMSQYLMYRATIRSGDIELASECLDNVAGSNMGFELLYACVADSQRVGDKAVIIAAMKKLAEVYDFERPGKVHLPALHRCTIMLLHGLLNADEKVDQDHVVGDMCSMFEEVVVAVQRCPRGDDGNRLFDVKELEWFCQNAYNLGLKHASDWDLKSVVRMLTACVNLIRNFPDDIAAEMASDLSLRSIFCNFLIASALVALARAENNLESQLQAYLVMRKHIAEVDHEVETRLQSKNVDDVSARDLLAKLAQLLAFDFEAAMALKKYPDLGEIVVKANQCRNVETFKAMADCALRSRLPPEELFSVLRKIINQISDLDDSDPPRLATYTRCLFQATFPFNEELGSRLLDEICAMVKDAHTTPATWPSEEVEWFAASAYNHSIDLCGRDDMEACKRWAQKALSLAHYCGDGGHFEALLQEKYLKLKLDVE